MGFFYGGDLVGGVLKWRRLPAIDGNCSVTVRGGGRIRMVLPQGRFNNYPAGTVYEGGNPDWFTLMNPGQTYIGYAEDLTNFGNLNAGPVSRVAVTEQGLVVEADGISDYLDKRYLGNSVLDGNVFPTMDTTTTLTLGPYTYLYQMVDAALNKLQARAGVADVPIYSSLGGYGSLVSPWGLDTSYSFSYKESDFISIPRMMEKDAKLDDDTSWIVIPRVNGQENNSTYNYDTASSVKWQIAGRSGALNVYSGSTLMTPRLPIGRSGGPMIETAEKLRNNLTNVYFATMLSSSTSQGRSWRITNYPYWEGNFAAVAIPAGEASLAAWRARDPVDMLTLKMPRLGHIRPGWNLVNSLIAGVDQTGITQHVPDGWLNRVWRVTALDVPYTGAHYTMTMVSHDDDTV